METTDVLQREQEKRVVNDRVDGLDVWLQTTSSAGPRPDAVPGHDEDCQSVDAGL